MRRWAWSRLSRGTQIGMLVALVALAPFMPFLGYAGLAVMNASAEWAGPAGNSLAALTGVIAFGAYLLVMVSVPLVLGGLLGRTIQRALGKAQERGA